MFKFAVILLLVCILFRWAFGSWPWQMLRASKPRGHSPVETLDEARLLLGVKRGAGEDEIRAAHKRLVGRLHPDRGGSAAEFHAANEARDLLLAHDGEKRRETEKES